MSGLFLSLEKQDAKSREVDNPLVAEKLQIWLLWDDVLVGAEDLIFSLKQETSFWRSLSFVIHSYSEEDMLEVKRNVHKRRKPSNFND